ncbi:hypothetical protein PHYSODRAFT_476660 [Phytophthora sojae]|uniref:Uncharacterized protein n=1 Tax=Phytophthora sojae (strain P6497) TaxID=1094619 RepID=G4YPP2_PHYSP|nr:hypothetical protein PHYSODRAFT_476660 [Phytophthora sojae]EGZ28639.1 hypothetical protein PHYSODRAFT_476660 [Phytophthora sojae]|eukprot:XP_009515914.1 hypothetical protein PHYSODRAFT_476660 [Phytophthora sojae]
MDFGGSGLGKSNSEYTASGSPEVSRFNVVVINFLLVRILIPHVILQPWNVGIGSKNIGKQTSANLLSLATLLYCVCRQLSPLPPLIEPADASFLGRRRSKTATPSQPDDKHSPEAYFLSIDEIGRRLLPDKSFPSNDSEVVQVVNEHQAALHVTLIKLRAQLHGTKETTAKPS